MKPRLTPTPPRRRQRGVMLVEALVYISVMFIVLALAGAAYARVLDQTRHLRRVADDIRRALDAGEQWRADVRSALTPPRLVREGEVEAIHLAQNGSEVIYLYDGTNVLRRAGSDADWQPFLPRVKTSRFVAEPRRYLTAWRWEIELMPGPRPPRLPPRFSFIAVASKAGDL